MAPPGRLFSSTNTNGFQGAFYGPLTSQDEWIYSFESHLPYIPKQEQICSSYS